MAGRRGRPDRSGASSTGRPATSSTAPPATIFDELNVSPATLPGATELLTILEASSLTFAIATASQPGQVAVSVAALRLPVPPRIIDAGHVEHAKPAPDLLLVAAEQVGVAPGRCWYVGDSAWDMMAGAAAGMPAVGVTTGATDAADLRRPGPRW
jgi:HAD superfamily hydrolase (TIGR01509 family)